MERKIFRVFTHMVLFLLSLLTGMLLPPTFAGH